MKNIKSNIHLSYPSNFRNRLIEVLLFLLLMCSFLVNHLNMLLEIQYVFYIILGIIWVGCFIRFRKNTKTSFIKSCSLQLMLCGILGAIMVAVANQYFPVTAFRADTIIILLLFVMILINSVRYQDRRTIYHMTFLLFPYCLLSVRFFLITGFLSTILLLIGFFNGTLIFENQRMEDEDYFGNSSR